MAEERIIPSEVGPHNIIEYDEHVARYGFACRFVRKGCVGLDIACGSGYGTDMLAKKDASKWCGVDVSPEAIAYAAAHYRDERLEFLRSDALELKFPPASFDMIVSFETIEHFERSKAEQFLRSISGLLKEGGSFIISCPNRDTYPKGYAKNPFHLHEYSFGEISGLLKKYFSRIDVYCQEMRYFKRSYKKMVQFSRHLPAVITASVTSLAGKKYSRTRDIRKLGRIFRLALYEYRFGKSVFPFVEDYTACKPAFLIFVCKR
ncbi:MAG: methyltransferase domain-containing protein [Candidatus Omnitrophica bacterium]|nr:methyltransferase domain-containing protein [Candidatus Omnitrophota bacterium]